MQEKHPSSPIASYSKIMLFLVGLGILLIISPILGGAFSDSIIIFVLLGSIISGTGVLLYYILQSREQQFKALFTQKNLLAHWTLSTTNFDQHTLDRQKRNLKVMQQRMLILLLGIILPVGFVIFSNDSQDNLAMIILVFLPIVLIFSGFTLYHFIKQQQQISGQNSARVYISKIGLWVDGDLHLWNGPEKKPTEVRYDSKLKTLIFKYLEINPSTRGSKRYEEQRVQLQVPNETKAELDKILQYYNGYN